MNPYVILGVIAALASAYFAGWQMRGDHEDAAKYDAALAYAAAYEAEVGRTSDVATQAEKDIQAIRTKARTREEKLKGELNNATYRTCMLPESGRMLYNAAVRDANRAGSGQPGESVPASGTPAKPGDDGRPVAGRD